MDFTSTQTCATDSPLKLPKYHYGGLGFRGNWAWNGPDAMRLLTSEGETDRKKANETRAKWCWIGGLVDGQTAGVTILGAPTNFRAPQPIRMHPERAVPLLRAAATRRHGDRSRHAVRLALPLHRRRRRTDARSSRSLVARVGDALKPAKQKSSAPRAHARRSGGSRGLHSGG